MLSFQDSASNKKSSRRKLGKLFDRDGKVYSYFLTTHQVFVIVQLLGDTMA